MASFFSHPAFPVAARIVCQKAMSSRLFWLCVLLTLLPDADVIAFRFGIPYASPWGHRGFTHSIVFSLLIGLCFIPWSQQLRSTRRQTFLWCFLSTLSHTLFDALTDGGLGVALFWPFTNERYFFPWRPVAVSPIGVKGFLGWRGVMVVLNEILWLWLPSLALAFSLNWLKRSKAKLT